MSGASGKGAARRRRRISRWLAITASALAGLLALAVVGLLIWSGTGVMAAEPEPWQGVLDDPAVSVAQERDAVVLRPAHHTGPERGMVFYPGAKVEPEAYAARLSGLVVEDGMTVVIADPWLHLALFDRRDPSTFTTHAPEVEEWFVGGHSMGGVRACQVAPESAGLLLLGSYCATDLSGTQLPVLSIGGEQDGLSTPEKISGARDLLPGSASMVQVPGANHASFGDYGPQAGDGTASISDGEMTARVTGLVHEELLSAEA